MEIELGVGFLLGGVGAVVLRPALVCLRRWLSRRLQDTIKDKSADRILDNLERDPYFGREYARQSGK